MILRFESESKGTDFSKMVDQTAPNSPPSTEKSKHKQELSEPTMSRRWQNSARFTAIKQMLNQENGNLETVGKLGGSLACPGPPCSLYSVLRCSRILAVGPWSLAQQEAEQSSSLLLGCVCPHMSEVVVRTDASLSFLCHLTQNPPRA